MGMALGVGPSTDEPVDVRRAVPLRRPPSDRRTWRTKTSNESNEHSSTVLCRRCYPRTASTSPASRSGMLACLFARDQDVPRSVLAQRVMRTYNAKGIFSNEHLV